MVYQENDQTLYHVSRISRPGTNQSTHEHDCLANTEDLDSTQLSQKIRISSAIKQLKAKDAIPTDPEALPDQSGIKDISTRSVRPNSANTVLQYADVPIQIGAHHLGRPTRGTILRNLKRSQSATSTCSDFSWITDNRRLCNIRDYYRLCSSKKIVHNPQNGESVHAFLTGARFNSAHWLDSLALSKRGLYINKQDLSNIFQVPNPPCGILEKSKPIANRRKTTKSGANFLNVTGKKIQTFVHKGTNTEKNQLSLDSWHGAEWQKEMPKMYGKKQDRYNPNISVPMRSKRVKSEYRDPVKNTTVPLTRTKSAH